MSIFMSCQFLPGLKRHPSLLIAVFFIFGVWGGCEPEIPEELSLAALRSQEGSFSFETVPSAPLEDRNPSSQFYGHLKESKDFEGQVTAWYFVHASCPYCRSQYALLDQMQEDLKGTQSHWPIQILAVNAEGHEVSFADLAAEGDVPILQDDVDTNLWGLWGIDYRDVVVVDQESAPIAILNLTENNLADLGVYTALKNLIFDVASEN